MSTEDLRALLELQAVDTSIDQHRHRRANLPESAQLKELDGRLEEAHVALGAAGAALQEVESRQQSLEEELASAEKRSAEVNRRLYGGEVSASRELQAMSDDLEGLKARASHLEDRILEVLEEREPLDARIEQGEAEISRLVSERDGVEAALQGAEAVVDSEMADLELERQAAAAAVPESLMSEYERLRSRLGGVAVARLVGNHCDGCHLTLPATELDRIRHLPPGEMVTCDQCGRILVPGN